MKIIFNKITVLVAVLCFTTGCNEFLKEEPKGQAMDNLAFAQHSDLEGAVHALNRQVLMATKGRINFDPYYIGDDITTRVDKPTIRNWDTWDVTDEENELTIDTGCWYWLWKVIKAANYIINGAANTPEVTADELTFALGQAHYWRAYSYSILVRFWGPVPLMLSGDIDLQIPVSSIEEVYDLIVSDLLEAEKLPDNYTESPWAMNGKNVAVSKGAAQASLAYIYMCMAGWPMNKTEYYPMAAAKALEVIEAAESGRYYYQLYDEYKDIHSRAQNWTNKEAILAIYYSSVTGTGDDSEAARGCICDIHTCSDRGYNDACAEIGFWMDFPEGPRKEWTFAPVTYFAASDTAVQWWDPILDRNMRQPMSRKSAFTSWGTPYENEEYDHWKSFNSQSNGWSLQIHQVVRLAEVYCWYAEAIGRSGQTNARAISLLNKVRNRADGHGPVDDPAFNLYPANMSANELAEAAYNEHGWEIAMWYWGSIAPRATDMIRMDRVKDHFELRKRNPEYTIPNSGGVVLQELLAPTGNWDQTKMFLPYPAADKRLNPNLIDVDKLNLIFKK